MQYPYQLGASMYVSKYVCDIKTGGYLGFINSFTLRGLDLGCII